ncbi:unnamed protein product [Didymodactylos carnosus]|uniref:Homeobox domain-containing protein n=2 Tax=Didymodactylos carnosus TaxID=1234261 RepID=A0A8S2ICX8_9BILA|nr:unnamed protein product [Didymodactylos carnosus]CAF3733864.1 unnamed protein product [Didymodactylos carnosus]
MERVTDNQINSIQLLETIKVPPSGDPHLDLHNTELTATQQESLVGLCKMNILPVASLVAEASSPFSDISDNNTFDDPIERTAQYIANLTTSEDDLPDLAALFRRRTVYSPFQKAVLEKAFRIHHYPSVRMIQQLSVEIGVAPDRLRVWFNNRRQRYKRQELLARIATHTFSPHSGCALTCSPMPIITQVTSGEEPYPFTALWNPSATMARSSVSHQNPSVLPPPSSVPRLYPSYNRRAPTNSTGTTTLGNVLEPAYGSVPLFRQ